MAKTILIIKKLSEANTRSAVEYNPNFNGNIVMNKYITPSDFTGYHRRFLIGKFFKDLTGSSDYRNIFEHAFIERVSDDKLKVSPNDSIDTIRDAVGFDLVEGIQGVKTNPLNFWLEDDSDCPNSIDMSIRLVHIDPSIEDSFVSITFQKEERVIKRDWDFNISFIKTNGEQFFKENYFQSIQELLISSVRIVLNNPSEGVNTELKTIVKIVDTKTDSTYLTDVNVVDFSTQNELIVPMENFDFPQDNINSYLLSLKVILSTESTDTFPITNTDCWELPTAEKEFKLQTSPLNGEITFEDDSIHCYHCDTDDFVLKTKLNMLVPGLRLKVFVIDKVFSEGGVYETEIVPTKLEETFRIQQNTGKPFSENVLIMVKYIDNYITEEDNTKETYSLEITNGA